MAIFNWVFDRKNPVIENGDNDWCVAAKGVFFRIILHIG